MSRRMIQFGAGSIGRSFLAQLFSAAGYEVVFVDVDERVVSELNRRGSYEIVVKQADTPDRTLRAENVRAISAREGEAVAHEIESCDIAATAVGKEALPAVAASMAGGLQRRIDQERPLDVILAENVRGARTLFRESLSRAVGSAEAVERYCGLVETSIGKMVPIVPAAVRNADPLIVYAEPYNTLIADAHGFRCGVPDVPGLAAVSEIDAYVDRKLFVHNLGHAATAYIAFYHDPSISLVADAIERPEIAGPVRHAMDEACAALLSRYPHVFHAGELAEHRDELLHRFRNRALGDTLFRVGRDVARKLGREDRIIGAMLLAARRGHPYGQIAEVAAAAFRFRGTDEEGRLDPRDEQFHTELEKIGMERALQEICGLDPAEHYDAGLIEAVTDAYRRMS